MTVGTRGTSVALEALRPLSTGRTGRTAIARLALGAGRTDRTLRTSGTGRTSLTLQALLALRTSRTLSAILTGSAGLASGKDGWIAFAYAPTGVLNAYRPGDRLADGTTAEIQSTDVMITTEEGGVRILLPDPSR